MNKRINKTSRMVSTFLSGVAVGVAVMLLLIHAVL